MKNNILIGFIFLLAMFLACACSSHEKILLKDKNFTGFWEVLPDCCVQEIKNNKYNGLILDGHLLCQTDTRLIPTIELITGRKLDSVQAFDYILDDSIVLSFENQCVDSSYISNSPRFVVLKDNLYDRQYLGIIIDGNKYLFASFQRSNSYCEYNKHRRKQCYQVFRLIYSRWFLSPGIDYNAKDNIRFWMLYDIANRRIFTY